MVADRIIAELEKGIIPWQKPWIGTGACVSYTSGKPYSMLNECLLGEVGEFITCAQCNKLGGKVKKGAKSKIVVFFKKMTFSKTVTDEEGNESEVVKVYPVLKYYNVFNVRDCEGIEPHQDIEGIKNNPVEAAEQVISAYLKNEPHLIFRNDSPSDKAYFSPASDAVVVPMINQYPEVAEYYSTTFHELTHSTGIKSRCDRGLESCAAFGSEVYSAEELVAEMGAAMLVNKCGIDCEKAFKNSAAYIQGWLKHLKDDRKALVVAAARAEKAVKYITQEGGGNEEA